MIHKPELAEKGSKENNKEEEKRASKDRRD